MWRQVSRPNKVVAIGGSDKSFILQIAPYAYDKPLLTPKAFEAQFKVDR